MTTIAVIKGYEYSSSSNIGYSSAADFWTCPTGKIAKVILSSVSHGINRSQGASYVGTSAVWVNEGTTGDRAHRTYLSALTLPSGSRTVQAGLENPSGYSGHGNTAQVETYFPSWLPMFENGWQGSPVSHGTQYSGAWMPEIIMTEGEKITGQAYYQSGQHWLSIRGLAYLEDIS